VDRFDFVVIGAGPAGEAAAGEGRRREQTVAVVDRELFGGACPFWACMPSKSLLHAAAIHALGGDYDWQHASDRRDYMINREDRDTPDDSSHVESLRKIGAEPIRGEARLTGPGRVAVAMKDGGERTLEARHVILAVGSHTKRPLIDGLEDVEPWTNREATGARRLPRSLVSLGGGPTGVELSQVYARYGVPVALVESNPRVLARDHARNSESVRHGLERDGVDVRTGVRAERVHARAGKNEAHRVELSDGSAVEGHEILLAIGREFPLGDLGLDSVGLDPGRIEHDGRLRLADGLWVVGDPAGPELHTHVSHYQGELAVRMALGDPVRPDYSAIPRCTYTDPEAAFVGLSIEQAREAGHDCFELVADLATSSKGYVAEVTEGHVTIVVDQAESRLLGAAIAGVGGTEVIHEAVLAIKSRTPLAVLADTIHAFPTTARVMGGLFADAARQLESGP
jgi:dihydrolipoamide dehydrogenase